jgi:serine/threonine protein kinase
MVAVTGTLDRYREIRRLGSGGMATVMLAEDTLLGREVALKRMTVADVRGLSRLRREALVGASISHPNLVSIYDVLTTDDDEVVIVMEYIPGETLRDRIEREGKLPVDEALRILEGTAAGLDAIHERGIVHRDVKPPNILLSRDGSVKLADLGIASAPDRTRLTTAGQVLGSFSYMAPEQLEDGPVTVALDIYALAAVAYEALSGTKARPESNPLAVAHAIATQPPPDLRGVWPEAPAATAELLTAAMARDPARRPQPASQLVGRLRETLEPSRPATAATRVAAPAQEPEAEAAVGPPPGASRAWMVPAALLLLIAGILLAVVLSSGGGSSQSVSTAATHPPASAGHAGSTASGKAKTASPPAASSTPQSASTPSSASSSGSGTAGSSAGSSSGGGAAGAGATGAGATAGGGAGSPVSAVESFYHLAAGHDYSAAWALADPAFRNQLGGYNSFVGGQSGDRSITFNDAHVTNQSANSATVQVSTTSVRSNGTQHCGGTVNLTRAGTSSGWLLDQIGINCQ